MIIYDICNMNGALWGCLKDKPQNLCGDWKTMKQPEKKTQRDRLTKEMTHSSEEKHIKQLFHKGQQ